MKKIKACIGDLCYECKPIKIPIIVDDGPRRFTVNGIFSPIGLAMNIKPGDEITLKFVYKNKTYKGTAIVECIDSTDLGDVIAVSMQIVGTGKLEKI